jgi:hypothetical protein
MSSGVTKPPSDTTALLRVSAARRRVGNLEAKSRPTQAAAQPLVGPGQGQPLTPLALQSSRIHTFGSPAPAAAPAQAHAIAELDRLDQDPDTAAAAEAILHNLSGQPWFQQQQQMALGQMRPDQISAQIRQQATSNPILQQQAVQMTETISKLSSLLLLCTAIWVTGSILWARGNNSAVQTAGKAMVVAGVVLATASCSCICSTAVKQSLLIQSTAMSGVVGQPGAAKPGPTAPVNPEEVQPMEIT